MKNAFKFFGLLDVISIVLLSPQIYHILLKIEEVPRNPLSVVKISFTVFVYLLLFPSASGLYKASRVSIISYYVQFPLRLVVWIFSFGFLTYLSEYSANELVFDWLFRMVFVLEFFRIYFTVRSHRSPYNR